MGKMARRFIESGGWDTFLKRILGKIPNIYHPISCNGLGRPIGGNFEELH
jgi:hypothetical protein